MRWGGHRVTHVNEQARREYLTMTRRLVLPDKHILFWGTFALIAYNLYVLRRTRPLKAQASSARPPIPTLARTPRISVLVAAWNESEHIDAHMRSFLALGYPDIELILCAGGSDDTLERARRYADDRMIILDQHPGEGKQRALARCLERASGAIIYLTDADCRFSDAALCALAAPLVNGQACVATGVSEPLPDQRCASLVRYQWFGDELWAAQLPPTVDGVLGRNCALLRRVVEELRVFDTPVHTGTDYFLSRRLVQAGYTIHAVPQSRVATEYPATCQAYVRMWRRWNKNLLIHGVRFGAWRDVKGVLIASGLYSSILFLPVLAPALGPSALVGSALLFGAATASRLRRAVAGAHLAGVRIGWTWFLRLPGYTALDMLAVLLAVRDSLDARARTQW